MLLMPPIRAVRQEEREGGWTSELEKHRATCSSIPPIRAARQDEEEGGGLRSLKAPSYMLFDTSHTGRPAGPAGRDEREGSPQLEAAVCAVHVATVMRAEHLPLPSCAFLSSRRLSLCCRGRR